jgi:hypothetical protein
MNVRIVVFGRNYDATEHLPGQLTLPEDCTLDAALERLAALLPGGRQLSDSCLVAVSGTHLGTIGNHRPRTLRDGDELLIVAPVAGG